MTHGGYVYIITNKNNSVLYTGVTSNLKIRIWEHITKVFPESFSAKYNCKKLIWYEQFDNIVLAINREKQIKGGSRMAKIKIIESVNPQWKNLWEEIKEW